MDHWQKKNLIFLGECWESAVNTRIWLRSEQARQSTKSSKQNIEDKFFTAAFPHGDLGILQIVLRNWSRWIKISPFFKKLYPLLFLTQKIAGNGSILIVKICIHYYTIILMRCGRCRIRTRDLGYYWATHNLWEEKIMVNKMSKCET